LAFVLAHVSDFHVSTFGDTFHDRARIVRRSATPVDTSPARFDVAWEEAGWKVLHAKGAKRSKITLVDSEGFSHPIPSVRQSDGDLDPVERAAAKACRLEARRASTLASSNPSDGALAVLLQATPKNSNVRLLRAARAVAANEPDLVVITGDLTDDGDGYDLVEGAFARWKEKGRLLAIPGNHDLYLFPIAGSGRPRATAESKRAAWNAFAARIGLELDETGAWTRGFPEAGAVLVGLNSCARRQRRFFRQNGAIGAAQLEYLRRVASSSAWKKARHRIVLLHHHVVPLPHGVGKSTPTEFGMRLDDARTVAEVLDEVGTTLVMHGHRHVSEERQPAGTNFRILASPSLTLGCRSGDVPSFWRVELGEHAHAARVRIPVAAVQQEADPGTEEEPIEP
jgi:3',5'-cyclic AMP phosphodiesterase CpdA